MLIGLGAMIGAGVFAAFAPAARAAGNALLLALLVAGFVAYCNATSSAQLAALHPRSGGTYVYGRERLGPAWGFLAGWGFVVGKLASCAAMALTFGHHAAPEFARPLALLAVVASTAVNCAGVAKTALLTRVIVALVLASLATVVVSVWAGGNADPQRIWPPESVGLLDILQSAGFLFFAFAGYARIATLGEEVKEPSRVIPRAIPLALFIALVVYGSVAASALAGAGSGAIAASSTPLVTAVQAGSLAALSPVVRIGAAIASLGVLLSLIAGVGRTIFAMASNTDFPRVLAAVHPRTMVPHRAEIAAGAVVVALVVLADVRSAIGFSSFAVLVYYAVTNVAAWTLSAEERIWPRALAAFGLGGCLALAFTLPIEQVLVGSTLLGLGLLIHLARRRRS